MAQYPFAEKGAAEAVFPVVVVDYVLSFKFGDGLFDGCGVEDLCSSARVHRRVPG